MVFGGRHEAKGLGGGGGGYKSVSSSALVTEPYRPLPRIVMIGALCCGSTMSEHG